MFTFKSDIIAMPKLLATQIGLLLGTTVTYPLFAQDISPAPEANIENSSTSAADSSTLDTIVVKGNTVDTLAPSAVSLDATQPTSVIDERFIRDGLRFNANYDDIVKYSPSVTVTSPEGPGLGKNEGLSIRGFQDGQYNVTFDGIPFGNSNDLHHTTSAYFTNHVLGGTQIDRGPGNASTIGNATFGGTIALQSREPSLVNGITPYLTFGSWKTGSIGLTVDETMSNTRVFGDISKEQSDTFLRGTDDRRGHVFLKTATNFSDGSELTFVTSQNKETQNTVQGATKETIMTKGWRFGLSDDPKVQSYKGYNGATYLSGFTYLGISTNLAGLSIDDKVYFNRFSHKANKAKDATDNDPTHNGVTFYDAKGKAIKKTTADAAADVPGKRLQTDFHSVGNILRLNRDTGLHGNIQAGLWLERTFDTRWSINKDLTTNQSSGSKTGNDYTVNLSDRLETVQPYLQYDWKINERTTLSPGVRYSRVTRYLSPDKALPGAENLTTKKQSYHATLPSITVHEKMSDSWSAYLQLAEGFLAPPLDVIKVNNGTLKPENTKNIQIGTTFASKDFNFGADIYRIKFDNRIAMTPVSSANGTDKAYINGDGAIYKGMEIEGTYALTRQLSVYENISYNRANYHANNIQLENVPRFTNAFGFLYTHLNGFFGSLMAKSVSWQYGSDNTSDKKGNVVFVNDYRIPGYTTIDGAFGYRTDHGPWGSKGFSVSMDINNLFNVHKITQFAGLQSVGKAPTFFGLPGRGVFVDVSVKL